MTDLVLSAAICSILLSTGGCAKRAVSGAPQSSVAPGAYSSAPEAGSATQSEQFSLADRIRTNMPAPAAFEGEGWKPLFNSSDQTGWQEVGFGGGGRLEIGPGFLLLNMGEPFSGMRFTNDFPVTGYEIALDAMRVLGSDFFCGLTVPVGESFCSLIIGGWGGSLVGISSLNGMDASENETTRFLSFENNRWYRVRLRVTPARLEAWIDKEKIVDVAISSKLVTLRPGEIEECKPLGLATWQTAAAFREIRFRAVSGPADPPRKTVY